MREASHNYEHSVSPRTCKTPLCQSYLGIRASGEAKRPQHQKCEQPQSGSKHYVWARILRASSLPEQRAAFEMVIVKRNPQ